MAPKQTDPQFKLRLTPSLKESIEKAASQNNRSINSEILERLKDSFNNNFDESKLLSDFAVISENTKKVSELNSELIQHNRDLGLTIDRLKDFMVNLANSLNEISDFIQSRDMKIEKSQEISKSIKSLSNAIIKNLSNRTSGNN